MRGSYLHLMSKVLSKVVSAGTGATKETVGLTGDGNDSGCDLRRSGRCRSNNNNNPNLQQWHKRDLW